MKRSRFQVSTKSLTKGSTKRPTPFAGPIETEQLESRRLFAGVAVPPPAFVASTLGFAPPGSEAAYMMNRSLPRAAMAWQSTVFGGPMLVVTEIGRVTAASSVTTAALTAAQSSTASSATTESPATSPAPPLAPTGTAAASLTRTATPAATTEDAGLAPAALVQSADTNSTQVAMTPVAAAVARSTEAAIAAGTAGRVFGPFTISATPAPTATAAPSGLTNLLALNERAQSTARRWTDQAGTVRSHRMANNTAADEAEGELPVIVAAGQTAEQATLAAFVGDAAVRPLWQRISIATAGVTLVAANWFVRRRNRKLAAAGTIREA